MGCLNCKSRVKDSSSENIIRVTHLLKNKTVIFAKMHKLSLNMASIDDEISTLKIMSRNLSKLTLGMYMFLQTIKKLFQ